VIAPSYLQLTTREHERVGIVDMRPLVIHLLAGLEQAGIERAVVTLGHDAAQVAECVTAYNFTRMRVDFVYLTLGTSAVGAAWRNLANSVIAARAVFEGSAPLLITRADNLCLRLLCATNPRALPPTRTYCTSEIALRVAADDARLLRRIACAPFGSAGRRSREGHAFGAYVLLDTTPCTRGWAASAPPDLTRVALASHDRAAAIRCGMRLGAFDGVVAGEAIATTPRIFEILASLFAGSLSTSLADAMGVLADEGSLGVVEVGELDCHWFAPRTLAGIFQPPAAPPPTPEPPVPHLRAAASLGGGWRSPRASAQKGAREGVREGAWSHLHVAARELLYSGEWRPTANMPKPPLRGELERRTEPLLQLGSTLGEGAFGLVVEAEPGPRLTRPAEGCIAAGDTRLPSRLAVKMIAVGAAARQSAGSAGGASARGSSDERSQMEAVMWEVHVLRQLSGHPNIVRLIDTVELADAVYVVMERIEGPDLHDHIHSQPAGRLAEPTARHLFRHLLAGLRHAHDRAILHCDLKPANVRLHHAPFQSGTTPHSACSSALSPASEAAELRGGMRAVLVDWGLARHVDQQPANLMMGTAL
jgi:hypothetical protein